jgi:hypothetical protein
MSEYCLKPPAAIAWPGSTCRTEHVLDRNWPELGLRRGDRLLVAAAPGWRDDGLYLVRFAGGGAMPDDVKVRTTRGALRRRPEGIGIHYEADPRITVYKIESVIGADQQAEAA